MKIKPLSTSTVFGIAAPASGPLDPRLTDKGVAFLQNRGFQIVRNSGHETRGYLAGSDEDRAAELNALFRDDLVDVICCVRGGYGTLRILKMLDYDAFQTNPKLVIGYSDITALQLTLLARTRSPSISGPMVAVEWGTDDYDFDPTVWELLSGKCPAPLMGPNGEALSPVQSGDATGLLVGGNLSVLCKLVGTPFLPDLSGCILFIEEVSELPYQVDGMLAQLELAGVLESIAGLVIGELSPPERISDKPTLTYAEVIERYAPCVNGPVVKNLRYGHIKSKVSIPIGVKAELHSGDDAWLNVLEPVVASKPGDTR